MIEPKPAAVRPRVIVPDQGPTLLEDEVRARLERGDVGLVVLAGKPGSGLTTALGHLASVLGDDPELVLVDGPPDAAIAATGRRLVICSVIVNHVPREVWRIAPWTKDDCIEYLLAAHREACASVMRRVGTDGAELEGSPELWRAVLDRMAADESLPGVRAALRGAVEARLSDRDALATARDSCFTSVCKPELAVKEERFLEWDRRIGGDAIRLLRHEPARVLLAADHLVAKLRAGARKLLANHFPKTLVDETAEQLRGDVKVLEALKRVMTGRARDQHPMAASLLHAAGANWVPRNGRAPALWNAYLAGVRWPGVQLQELEVVGADLTDADLHEAQLQRVLAYHANLEGANLHGARVAGFAAGDANLADADLSFARAPRADFRGADLRGANLEGALLRGACFVRANLSLARLARAHLGGAEFHEAKLDDADFSGADLSGAQLGLLPLKRAVFTGATFDRAFLGRADMEDMLLGAASFVEADLQEALLTGSRIPGGVFRGANLSRAGLAEIEWEGADLRDADLRYCTFHLGSSRSGLVESPIACEGSRTGFYTDEFHEQDFKPPEEIRKANLRGADLRGAQIEHTDFYLVDLRDARYTADQEEHFRRTGAILETRV